MRKFRAGLLAAALATAVAVSLGAAFARDQDSARDQPAPDDSQIQAKHLVRYPVRYRTNTQAKTPAQSSAQVQSKDHAKAAAQSQVQATIKDQAKDQSKDQAKDHAAAAVHSGAQVEAKDQAKDQVKDQVKDEAKDQAKVPALNDSKDQAADQAKAAAAAASQAQDQAKDHAQDQPKDQTPASAQAPALTQAENDGASCPGNPNALGTNRALAIDFSQYKRLGHMQYPDSLALNDHEVVLTFDDGPLPPHTDQILDILAAQCVKATFFMVGEMAHTFPAAARRVYQEGHTIGIHSDHHPTGFDRLPLERLRAEIDGGIADIASAFGGDTRYLAPFFRIPGLERSDMIESELAARGLIVFSSDTLADDWHRNITPALITSLAISRLKALGKGILLLHDIHPKTVAALPNLLAELKANGFHIVQVVPSAAYEMAMLQRPAVTLLASAEPDELTIGGGMDNGGAGPAWPQTTDGATADAVALPVPDVATFDPDAGITVGGSTETQWPQPPDLTAIAPLPEPPPRVRRIITHQASGKRTVAGSDQPQRLWPQRHPERPARARASVDSHPG
jgi:peptidoglycan/xylan/chitin deacetylase (PgdA/CDA1 family)